MTKTTQRIRASLSALALAAGVLAWVPAATAPAAAGQNQKRSSQRRPMNHPPAFRRPAPMRAPRFTPRAQAPARRPQQSYHPQGNFQRPTPSRPASQGVLTPHPRGFFRPPTQDAKGRPLTAHPVHNMSARAPLMKHSIEDAAVVTSVQAAAAAAADRDGQYHWYKANGMRYAHWYDADHDRHWFGFYSGKSYLWSIYWKDNFWWQDHGTGRWLVFWRDHWWWHAPNGAAYVYVGDQYYNWNSSPDGGVVLVQAPVEQEPAQTTIIGTPDAEAQAQLAPQPLGASPDNGAAQTADSAPAPSGTVSLTPSFPPEYHYSADGTRMVQVEGEDHAAYLYDVTKKDANSESLLIRYLDQGVSDVRFTDTSSGSPLQIILTSKNADGVIKHVVYDAQGNPMGAASASQISPPPAESPVAAQAGADMPPSEAPMPDGI